MDDSKTTPPDAPGGEPGWGERRRRPDPPPRPQPPPRPEDDPLLREPHLTDPPPPHGDPLFDEQPEAHRGPYGRPPPPPHSGLDFSALFVLVDALRRVAPAELQDRMTAFIREGLLTLRSLIDWYLERLERPRREPKVEDIPID